MIKSVMTVFCLLLCCSLGLAQDVNKTELLVFEYQASADHFLIKLVGAQKFTKKDDAEFVTNYGKKRSYETRVRKIVDDISSLPYVTSVFAKYDYISVDLESTANKPARIREVLRLVEDSLCHDFDTYVSMEQYMVKWNLSSPSGSSYSRDIISYEPLSYSEWSNVPQAPYVPPKPSVKIEVVCDRPECK